MAIGKRQEHKRNWKNKAMARRTIAQLAFLTIAVCALLPNSTAQEVHVVGDDLGWTIPPGGPIWYDAWASLQTFDVGDILLFNFTNGDQDVAQVTKDAFITCDKTNPISVKKTSPANFTLENVGNYYFISTLDRHCFLGQKLAIDVSAPGPEPSPAPTPQGPLNYTVGDELGWVVPPGGEFAYDAWAHWKTFQVGDALVFNYINGTSDVAVVTKDAYERCEVNNTIAVYRDSPTRIVLNTTGEHFYTSTYLHQCVLGQKLHINVTSSGSSGAGTGTASSPGGVLPPSAQGPSAVKPVSSAPSKALSGYMGATFLFIAMAFFY